MLNAASKRRHAEILAARDSGAMAKAQVTLLRAEADLEDALAEREPTIADHAYIDRTYPVLGRCRYEGGRLIEIEHPWEDEQVRLAKAAGIDVAWQWCPDPAAGIEQGELIRIWIGTREAGPRLQWDRTSGKWVRLASHGNYNKNWACGGNWREDKPLDHRGSIYYDTMDAADPTLANIVKGCL